jgi:hypothetical protein
VSAVGVRAAAALLLGLQCDVLKLCNLCQPAWQPGPVCAQGLLVRPHLPQA